MGVQKNPTTRKRVQREGKQVKERTSPLGIPTFESQVRNQKQEPKTRHRRYKETQEIDSKGREGRVSHSSECYTEVIED